MIDDSQYLQVRCPRCEWSVPCDPRDMVQRLRQAKMLRREGQPDVDLVLELFRSAGQKLVCDQCGATGLIVELPSHDALQWGESGGVATRACEACGQPIPAERRELFPDARRCASCQASSERQPHEDVPEYCPKCGAVMTLRTSARGGITRYQLRCESCGAR